jgi:hypothetical protein
MADFSPADFPKIADYVVTEFHRRKNKRGDLEKIWKDIDRQIRIEPKVNRRLDGEIRDNTPAWIPEIELPLQAQTLEILTADARRMRFPDNGMFFSAHALMDDRYLDEIDLSAIISGDENDIPSVMTQDNIDKLVQGTMMHYHRQYDFFGNWDYITAETFKYGTGIGRARVVEKRVYTNQSKGVIKQKQKIPVLFPVSVKNIYLDDRMHFLMNEGQVMSPAIIQTKTQNIKDLQLAAKRGTNNPELQDGGWMPNRLKGLEGDKHGDVEIIEYEGDLAVPGSSTDIYIPNALVTVVVGTKGDASIDARVIRFRLRKENSSSYIVDPYHVEHIDSPYATSPLMKGWPIQLAAVEMLSRSVEAGALSVRPPVGYDEDNFTLKEMGGPQIHPGAIWPTIGKIETYPVGDPEGLMRNYVLLLQQYSDVTGVNAPRLGAQTNSHTTAFAKEAEISRGTIRTVDYVKSSLQGPMARWLDIEYRMGRELMDKTEIFIDAYGGFVTLSKKHLPKKTVFDVHGSGGPAEEQAKTQQRLQALQFSLSLDQLKTQADQAGLTTTVDLRAAIEQVLREGGWTDVDSILTQEQPQGPVTPGPVAPGAALQGLQP